jgi:peptidoglycan hydrolase CwlO-like protein
MSWTLIADQRDRALREVADLHGQVAELQDRIARRDDTIADLAAENQRLLRDLAEFDAMRDGEILA